MDTGRKVCENCGDGDCFDGPAAGDPQMNDAPYCRQMAESLYDVMESPPEEAADKAAHSVKVGSEARTIQNTFEEFHRRHPDVMRLFTEIAFQLRREGRKQFGAKAIMERIRWHYETTSGAKALKIPNVVVSRYARKFLEDHPEFQGFFKLTTLKTP